MRRMLKETDVEKLESVPSAKSQPVGLLVATDGKGAYTLQQGAAPISIKLDSKQFYIKQSAVHTSTGYPGYYGYVIIDKNSFGVKPSNILSVYGALQLFSPNGSQFLGNHPIVLVPGSGVGARFLLLITKDEFDKLNDYSRVDASVMSYNA